MVYRCEELSYSYYTFSQVKDQWENIGLHTQKGISFLETYSHFIRDRCQAEAEYARSLRRLVKSYLPKKKEDDESQFTYMRSFKEALLETGDMAGQHEVVAETLNSTVLLDTQNLIKEIKEDRKKHLNEGNKLQQQLQISLQQLEKSKKNYEKGFREAEKAEEQYRKADLDLNLSRAEVEKQKMNASIKNRHSEQLKNEYANILQNTNKQQLHHYTVLMPGVFQCLQEMDEKRITDFSRMLKKMVQSQVDVAPIIKKCLQGIVDAADSINAKTDSEIVIEKYKSGFTPPSDIQFDDLSSIRVNGDLTPVSHTPSRHDTIKGTISASKLRKRVGIFGIFGSNKNSSGLGEKDDYSDLPPNQRRKKIQTKIEEIRSKLTQEINSRDALIKMKEVYSENPSMGDASIVMSQLNSSYLAIDKLKGEVERFETMLSEEVEGTSGPNTPIMGSGARHSNGGASPRSPRSSVASDDSLSRSTSELSVNTQNSSHNTPPPPPPPPAPHLIPSSYTSPFASSTHNRSAVTTPGIQTPTPKTAGNSIPKAPDLANDNYSTPNRFINSYSSKTTTSALKTTTTPTTLIKTTTPTSNNIRSTQNKQPKPPSRTPTTTLTNPTSKNLFETYSNLSTHSAASGRLSNIISNKNNNNKTSLGQQSNSPESGIGVSRNSLSGSDATYDQPDNSSDSRTTASDTYSNLTAPHAEFDDYDDSYIDEHLPVIGTCVALYPFEATSEGSMRMEEGEKLYLIERDQGDGWTRVRRTEIFEEGFVPSSYIQSTLNTTC